MPRRRGAGQSRPTSGLVLVGNKDVHLARLRHRRAELVLENPEVLLVALNLSLLLRRKARGIVGAELELAGA